MNWIPNTCQSRFIEAEFSTFSTPEKYQLYKEILPRIRGPIRHWIEPSGSLSIQSEPETLDKEAR
jgi:hypothetical protein